MTAGTFLVALTLVVLVLLLWHLRWVLLVLFGAVVVAVALDVLIVQVQKRTRLKRPQALAAVLGILLFAGGYWDSCWYRNSSASSSNWVVICRSCSARCLIC